MGSTTNKRRATYEDVIALPEHVVGEIVDGELHVSPRPGSLAALATSKLFGTLERLNSGGGDGPNGWWIVFEPELHLGTDVLVPDLAGWRLVRMPTYPDVHFFTLAPDWICEVLLPGTARLDLVLKLPKYARAGVEHVWIVDPIHKTLQVFRRAGKAWGPAAMFAGADRVHADPFAEFEFELDALWPVQAGEDETAYRASRRRPRARRKATKRTRTSSGG